MPDIVQNTLYLTTPGSYISRDHLTLQVKVPLGPSGQPATLEDLRSQISDFKSLSIPVHMLESICVFGPSSVSPPALDLCWEHGVAVNFLSDNGYLQARMTGVADTSVMLRRAQFRAADRPAACAGIARQIVAGKMQNSRNSLLRAARETDSPHEQSAITTVTDALARQVRLLAEFEISNSQSQNHGTEAEFEISNFKSEIGGRARTENSNLKSQMNEIRGAEGLASNHYFAVFTLMLKQQRDAFAFSIRSRRPPRDRVNCLLSFLYALVRHDCIAALTAAGLDPFVGFLHVDRPNRPSLALDLMEEFRPWLADRLAVTLINRQQIGPGDFREREGGAVEFTDAGRKLVIKAYQERKQESMNHPLLDQNMRIGKLPFIQARVLARHLRDDIPHYVPFVPK